MAGRKPTPINLKPTFPERVVRTFKSTPEAARELGFDTIRNLLYKNTLTKKLEVIEQTLYPISLKFVKSICEPR